MEASRQGMLAGIFGALGLRRHRLRVTFYSVGSITCFRHSLVPPFKPLTKFIAVAVAILSLAGCDTDPPTSIPRFTKAPELLTVDAPVTLAALVTFEADQPVLATYRITDGRDSWQAHTRFSAATASNNSVAQAQTQADNKRFKRHADKTHREILLKFKPNTQHRIYVRITNAAGQTTEYAKPLLFSTPPLPEGFPKIYIDPVTSKSATDQTPGAEQDDIALISLINNQSEPDASLHNKGILGWLIALDGNTAEVVWYMHADAQWHHFEQLQSGDLRLYSPAGSVLDVDMLGNKLAGWVAEGDTEFASYQARHAFPPIADSNAITSPDTVTGSQKAGLQTDPYHSWVELPNQHRLALSIDDANLISELDPLGDIHQQWDLMDILDPVALTVGQQKQYPLLMQQPVRMSALNKGAYQSLLLSYQLPIESGLSSHLLRLSAKDLLHSQDAPVRPKIALRLDSALIYDNKLVSRLIPPEFSESHRQSGLAAQSVKQKSSDPSPDKTPDKTLAARQSKLQIPDEIPIAEGDWQIELDSPQGTVKQTLKIDKQQGPIGLGYLDNYPVMVVIKGNRLQLKLRTTGTQGTATWRYSGTIDDSGFEAQGELNVSDDQNQILAANIPWQAYRQ